MLSGKAKKTVASMLEILAESAEDFDECTVLSILTDFDDFDLEEDADANYAVGFVSGVSEATGMSFEEIIKECT